MWKIPYHLKRETGIHAIIFNTFKNIEGYGKILLKDKMIRGKVNL